MPEEQDDSAPEGCEKSETAELVREELDRIPTKYRVPIVLHYFGGMAFSEVADQLSIKQATLGVRLFRGRKMLADRLARRGLALSSTGVAFWLGRVVRQSITNSLHSAAVRAALAPTAGQGSAIAASRLGGSMLTTFVVSSKVKTIVVLGLIALGAAAAGAAVGRMPRIMPNLDLERFKLPVPTFKTRFPVRIAERREEAGF